MILRLTFLVSLLGCLAAGPVSWDDSKCAQECNGGSKFHYSPGTAYIYNYEAKNELHTDKSPDLETQLKANVKITVLSKCEFVLELSNVESATASFAIKLESHPLPFSFNDGKIGHVCPHPDDSDEVNNVKKGILSALQNSMKNFEVGSFNMDTQVLGTCDTIYKSKEKSHETYEILKTINIPSCTNHLKGQTLLLASVFKSSSHRQHLPFMSGEKATCTQVIQNGLLLEASCQETATFEPVGTYGYHVKSIGHSKLKHTSTEPASLIKYKTSKKENLVFKYHPHAQKDPHAETEGREILEFICSNSKDLIKKELASYLHKLVYVIRKMDAKSVENLYSSLKNNELCQNGGKKTLAIYLDALRMASSGGSIALLSKLVTNGEMPKIDSFLWLTLLPFTPYVEEDSISAALPLIKKGVSNRQTLLGITALAHKYCAINPECEKTEGIKGLSVALNQFISDKCGANDPETEILTALKAFGNLGYVGDSANDLFECAHNTAIKTSLRIAAIDAFRRSPCKEETLSKLLDIYSGKTEHDELRVAALMSLSKCATVEVFKRVIDTYETETSNQVKVFTWSFLENLKTSSDPMKATIKNYLEHEDIKKPKSTDLTKFSRNFELSFFSEIFNLGLAREANIIHSADSFLPKSGNAAYKLSMFGNQIEPLEIGARVDDIEHILEKLFGPVGLLSNINIAKLFENLPEHSILKRFKRSAENYQSKIEALSERLGYKRNKVPSGTAFARIMGHELALLHLNEDSLERVASIKPSDLLKNLADLSDIDTFKNLIFLDVSILFPSITGRAYKLAGNGSISLGLKGEGKIDLRQPTFPIPRLDINGKFKPSVIAEAAASFSIYSEDYEPGVLAETVLSAGMDYHLKLEVKDGRLIHVKINRESKRSEILHYKRSLFYINHGGKTEMEKPPSHNLNYCTKYVQKLIGAKYCASVTIPHAFENGKFKIPFLRQMEASLTVEETDPTMNGYEFLLEIPDFFNKKNSAEKRFKILVDTSNSKTDRKFSLEVNLKKPNDDTCSMALHLHTPIYTLDGKAELINKDDVFHLSTDITGDEKRRYSVNIDATKTVKGARLVEYHPKVTVSLPSTRPVELTGTVIFSRGRKDNLSVNLESGSFAEPFTLKGSLAKEGEKIDLKSNWKINYEFTANMFSQIHRLHNSVTYEVDKGLFLDLGHHYEPDGRAYESVTVKTKIDNIKIFDRLSFNIDSEILFAEHQDINSMLKWDFSFKPLHHLNSDFIFRYGENFEDDTHLVRATIVSALHGDFDNFQKFSTENKVGLTISCFNFDKSASLSASWDLIDPKLIIDAGIKTDKGKEIRLDLNYRHIEKSPVKLATDFTFTYNTYNFKYKDEAIEISPHEYKWKSVIEPFKGKAITTDFMYRIKSKDDFHHEIEGTIKFPGLPKPIQQKGLFKFSPAEVILTSNTDLGRGNVYMIDVMLKRDHSEVKLDTPFLEGNLVVHASGSETRSIDADFRSKGRHSRHVVLSGKITTGTSRSLNLDVEWDADRDPEKKIKVELTSTLEMEEGVEKYIITGSVNSVNSIDLSGTISTDLLRGPHFFRSEFSGNVEPMAIEIEHEIKDGHMNSVTRYLRSGVEKIRADIKGKLIRVDYSHYEIMAEVLTSSPYKTFDGKSVFFRLLGDSTKDANTFISEYRMKFSPVIGYEGKFDYQRKRGWPGGVRANLISTVHNRPLYEGITNLDYGNGKYSWKTSFTPVSKRKINFVTSFEHSTRFVAFHHSLATSLQLLQTVDLNAVADIRNTEDAKVHSNLDINSKKMYDVNSTLKMRSVIDFDAEATIFSKITPSLKVFSKAQSSGQITKYDFNLNVDSKDVITGSGEMKKRKRGFNGDLVFKYKEKEMLTLNVNQDGKGKHERNYAVKAKFPSRVYTAHVKVNKETKDIVHYETKFCRNEEFCIAIDGTHKELPNGYEAELTYKRGDVEFSVERIRESNREGEERFHTVIYKGDHRYGYDVRINTAGVGKSLSLGIILPSREIITKSTIEFSISKPRLILELSADGKNHPERKLITDLKFDNHLYDNNPSKLDISISHPIFEKPIELKLYGDYEPQSSKYFTAGATLDYSTDPDDKLVSKVLFEEIPGSGTDVILIDIYHNDEEHLDFSIKLNATANSNEESFAVVYNYKEENDVNVEALIIGSYLIKEKRFYFQYNRPKISYKLDGKITSSDSPLLNNTCLLDLQSVYNGETTQGKLVSDYETGCYKLTILNGDGEVSRFVELCLDTRSRNVLSLMTESLDDEGHFQFDYLLEIYEKSLNTLGIRHQINPDFLGAQLFSLTSLMEELTEAGVGTLPFYDSPRFKIIRRSFNAKVLEPAKEFIIPEAKKFFSDMIKDAAYLKKAMVHYYRSLPSLDDVKEYIRGVRMLIRSIGREILINIYSYYENYIRTAKKYMENIVETATNNCENNDDCKHLLDALKTGNLRNVLEAVKKFILSLPGKIQEIIENPSPELRNYMRSSSDTLKAYLEPLTKYRCGEIIAKIAKLTYETLQPRVQAFLEKVPNYYRSVKERLLSNEYYKTSVELLKNGYLRAREEILSIDYHRLAILARKYFEDYLSTLNPPRSPKDYITINSFNVEKGVIDMDLHIANRVRQRIQDIFFDITENSLDAGLNYNWNTLLIKLKRGLDLGFIPPYETEAMIIGHEHFVTFDKFFYDFAGECSYLLTRDFEDGNFTLVLKPRDGEKPSSILIIRDEATAEVTSEHTSVKVGNRETELPYLTKKLSVTREGNTIIVDTNNGLKVKCNVIRNICTIVLSGWYSNKVAGLLGTYNYEKNDEFKRPKGNIANSVNVFAKSWELKKACKTTNLVADAQINKNSDYYKLCKAHFQMKTSPLAACFSEVSPDEYFNLCLRHLATEKDQTNAFCNVAAAYATECDKNYVELSLPSKCLTCDAPDGTKLEHGDRKKFEKLSKKSSDTILIVEDHECNKVVSDLANLARSIERELENEGYRDNMFGVVGFGGEVGDPQTYTAKEKTLFGSRDLNSITERLKLESKKTDISSAFEAIKHAIGLFRSDTAKSIVLLSCSSCKYDLTSLQYPVVEQILLERGISLHVIRDTEIPIRKSKEKNIIGVDPDTVYHTKDVTERELIGEPNLRSQISMPKDLCIALSNDVNGSFFSTHPISKASSTEVKNWRSVFARKFLKSTQLYSCQLCDCTSTRDYVPSTVCQPCEMKRPRLPFSVGSSNVYTRTLETFVSYLLHTLRE